MSLINVELDLFVGFVKLARFTSGLQFPNHLLEDFHDFVAFAPLETLHMYFHATIRSDGNVKFALRHKVKMV